MTLLNPHWLILLIPLAAALWRWRMPTRPLFGLRAAVLLLAVLAVAGPAVRLPSRSGIVVIVADRSLSMPSGSGADQVEAIRIVRDARSSDDRLAVVSFGQIGRAHV